MGKFDGEAPEATPWAVLCPVHGRVFLREAEYDRQMDRADAFWECPKMDSHPERFGLCGYRSEFDDATYEASLPPAEEEPDPVCAVCGDTLEWLDCETCGCTGFNGHDCGEDCCMCADPDEDNVPCDICMGNGGWMLCPKRCPEEPPAAASGTDRDGGGGA